eukprot:TRINITY_DN543_c0_g1_i1.p1 TRINITY_DN543_c0_g1~~TRINITY_DN543_c0_g1_i1.p1  ORF type:complete len:155 (+),score=15.03 TRINITY_DN543_c0_g1_i1:101-565(+)
MQPTVVLFAIATFCLIYSVSCGYYFLQYDVPPMQPNGTEGWAGSCAENNWLVKDIQFNLTAESPGIYGAWSVNPPSFNYMKSIPQDTLDYYAMVPQPCWILSCWSYDQLPDVTYCAKSIPTHLKLNKQNMCIILKNCLNRTIHVDVHMIWVYTS